MSNNIQLPRNANMPELTVWFAGNLDPQKPTFYSRIPNAQPTDADRMYWQLSLWVSSEEEREVLEANGVPVKTVRSGDNQGKMYVSFKRNVLRANGDSNGAVKVHMADGTEITDYTKIGNGSKVTCNVYQMENRNSPGAVVNSLTSVTINELSEGSSAANEPTVDITIPTKKTAEATTAADAPF